MELNACYPAGVNGRVYVADRSRVEVKVYTEDGRLLDVWHQFGEPSGVYIHDNLLYVADETATIPVRNPNLSPGIRIATLEGKIFVNVPYRKGNTLEGVAVDQDGNIYGGNTNHPRSVRFYADGPAASTTPRPSGPRLRRLLERFSNFRGVSEVSARWLFLEEKAT